MKRIILIPVVLFFFVACDEKPKNPVAEYGDTMINSYKKGQAAGETLNLDAVKKSVQAYHAANDKYPQTLDEIKDMVGSQIDTTKYVYDAKTGSVDVKRN